MANDRSGVDNKSGESGWPIGRAFEVLLCSSGPESSQLTASESSQHEPSNKEPVDSHAGLPSFESSSRGEAASPDPGNEGSEAKKRPLLHSEDEVDLMQEDASGIATASTRHAYMDDEQIFASFDSKRRYEREWRKKKKKKTPKERARLNAKSLRSKTVCAVHCKRSLSIHTP